MKLGLTRDEVKLVPYTKEWITEFRRIQQEIIQSTKLEADRIEHIGSTAIIDIPAKPIIDILVGVDAIGNVDASIIKALRSIGFFRLRVERPGEIVFAKFADDTYEMKTHFIHLVDYDSELWRNLLFFRDYLNLSKEAREEYKKLKLIYAARDNMSITEYTNLKEPFVNRIYAKRLK